MAQNENDLSVTLPEELRRQFAEVQRRLWRVETTVAMGSILAALLVSLIALFVSDRIWNTSIVWRVVFLLVGLAASVVAIWNWAKHWLWRRRNLSDFANLVQKKYRLLGDRLLGIVELAQEQRHQANFSPALYHAAIHQVAEEARQYDFRESISTLPAKKFATGACVAMFCWLALCIALPQASWNAFRRWLAPVADIPRYTLVGIEGLPHELIVPHGEPFAISGKIQYRSFWKPSHVSGQLLTLPKIEGAVDSGRIRLQIPGQVENNTLRVRVGDAVAEVKIIPVHRPALRELSAQIHLPDYLKYPDQNQVVQSGSLQAVEGSRVAFQGKTSRALTSAQMQSTGGEATPLKVSGEAFTSDSTQPDATGEYTFNWRDELGLSNAAPLRLAVNMQKDAPPIPELPGMPRETAMLASDVLHIRTEANDDFGVLDLGLTWDLTSDSPLTEGYTSEVKVMPPSSHVKKAEKVFLWSPQVFRIPIDTSVELQGFARDYLPDRERSRTATYKIRVLSPEEHAELIRGELEAVMARIEEVTRLQEKIAANLQDVKDSEKLPASQKSARIGQSKNDQTANASHLDELSQQAASALQEAMKNPVFPPDTIRQWTQSAEQWQKLSREKMQDAAASMQSAQQSSPPSQQQTADAAQKAQDILKALEKMQDKASKHMDELQALTLAQRLRKVGSQEKEISAQLLKAAPDIVGLPPDDLPEKFKKFDQTLSADQGRTEKQSGVLQGEISRFFERTKKTNYGAVSQEMKDTHATDELEKIGGLIGDNIAVAASGNLGRWSDQFAKWGDKLEPKSDDSGQGSGGKSQAQDLTEQLIALLRLREGEMNLRDQTTVLDQQKGDANNFQDKARALSDTQKKIADELHVIDQKINIPVLDPAFAQTAQDMEQIESFLRIPDTGKPTDDTQVKTIDSLSDIINLINEQAQHGQPKPSPGESSSSEEMAFLLRMMQKSADAKAMALQPATGLNHAGGKTDRNANPVSGNTLGKEAASRNVDKASGVIQNAPAEFRDALDNYFHGIEQSKN